MIMQAVLEITKHPKQLWDVQPRLLMLKFQMRLEVQAESPHEMLSQEIAR